MMMSEKKNNKPKMTLRNRAESFFFENRKVILVGLIIAGIALIVDVVYLYYPSYKSKRIDIIFLILLLISGFLKYLGDTVQYKYRKKRLPIWIIDFFDWTFFIVVILSICYVSYKLFAVILKYW